MEEEDAATDESTLSVTAIERELANDGYRSTESECHQDGCDGTLWYDDHTVVCSTCWVVYGVDQARPQNDEHDAWEEFDEHRGEYFGSGRKRAVGGFLSAYDWVSSSDVDGPISGVSPDEFYQG